MNTLTAVLFASLAISAVLAYPGGHDGDDHQVPGYHYEYGVHDPHTKDHKSQEEHRDHDDVKGSYTIKEADGTKRHVEYTSGKKDGFQAVVKREGHAHHPSHHGKDGHDDGATSYVGVTHWGHGSGR